MTKKEKIINEIEAIPEPLLDEVLDFISLIKTKSVREKLNIYSAVESSLKKDWLNPEEDKAWKNL